MLKPMWIHHKGEKMWVPDGKIFWDSIKRMTKGDETILPVFRTTMTDEQALDRVFEAERRSGGVNPENEPAEEPLAEREDPIDGLASIFGEPEDERVPASIRKFWPKAKVMEMQKQPESLEQPAPKSVRLI